MYVVTVNRPMLDLLWERRVFHHSTSERWQVGTRLVVPDDGEIEPYSQILTGNSLPQALGAFSYSNSLLTQTTRVGRYSSIGPEVQWMGSEHPTSWGSTSPVFYEHSQLSIAAFRKDHGVTAAPLAFAHTPRGVDIGHDVWIGHGAMIAPGVTIGHGAIIGARSLVLKDVPPYAIVVGQPGRVLRLRLPEPLIERYLRVAWWRFAPDVLQPLAVDQPEAFLDALEEAVLANAPPEFGPVPLRTAEVLAAAKLV